MPADQPTPPPDPHLTAEEVGARVGAILDAAEREAREIIAAAHRDTPAEAPQSPAPAVEQLARAIEQLGSRLDALELSTAAALEALHRELHTAISAASAHPAPATAVAEPPAQRPPPLAETPAQIAVRIRVIDLALAGYSREAIADELAVAMDRTQVDALLDEILVA
jgi:hypothetical protein